MDRCEMRTSARPGWFAVALALLMVAGVLVLAAGSGWVQITGSRRSARSSAASTQVGARVPQPLPGAYQQFPLMFEPNQGQSDSVVKFLARGSGYGLFLTSNEAVLELQSAARSAQHPVPQISVVRMGLAGADPAASVTGTGRLPGKSNYIIGNNPAQWHRDVPQFAGVRYHNVYPGIDLVYHGNQGQLEYDFEVAPGSDASHVALRFEGAENLRIGPDGDLVLVLHSAEVRLKSPHVYQKFGDEERTVAGAFDLRGRDEAGFRLGPYDHSRTLVIDPVLVYSTYLGGSGAESCSFITGLAFTPGCPAITVDSASNAYIAGSTMSSDFPIPPGVKPYQGTLAGNANLFIAKFGPTGALQFDTYLGGNGTDYSAEVAVDAGFNIIVAGTTSSTDFPTHGTNAAFQSTPLSSGQHVFVSKLDSTGRTLLYSTYLSGTGADIASGAALDLSGNAYVTGTTTSKEVETGFPSTLGSFQPAPASGSAVQFFMTKVDPNLGGSASVAYSTYFGGGNPSTGQAVGGGIAVDINSDVYITGGTNFLHVGGANDFPILNAYQGCLDSPPTTTSNCPSSVTALDVFVAKLNPAALPGSQLIYSSYLGGSADEAGYGIAVDSNFDAYVTGSTSSSDFSQGSTTGPLQPLNGGGIDAFLAKVGVPCTGTSCTTTTLPLNYFTYLGGSGTDIGTAIAVDTNQGARVIGFTDSVNFPTLNNPLQSAFGGGTSDAFVARIDTTATSPTAPGHYSTYFGGNGTDIGTSIAVDPAGASYASGETSSSNFAVLNPFQGTLDGPSDAFLSKLGPLLNLTMVAVPTPSTVGVGNQVSFVYTVTNSGDFAGGIIFTDNLPTSGQATFNSATMSPGNCGSASGATVVCNIGTLNAGATATGTVILTPTAPLTPNNSSAILGNSASVSVLGAQIANANASVTVNDFALGVAPASVTVPAGVPAAYTATLSPTGYFPDSVSLSCTSGLPTGATCTETTNPIPNLSNGPASTTLVINTTTRVTTTTRLWRGAGPFYATLLPVAGLALLGVRAGGKKNRRILLGLMLGVVFACFAFLPACSSSSSTTTTTGTPAGTYTVTVSATSGSATRTQTVTLVVQ